MAHYTNYQLDAINAVLAELPASHPLRSVVAGKKVQDLLAQYEIADRHALKEQSSFKFWGRLRLWTTTLGVIVGSLLLLPLEALEPLQARAVLGPILAHLKSIFPTAAFAVLLLVNWRKPQQKWMTSRADAERLRGDIFQAILNEPAPTASDARTLQTGRLTLLRKAFVEDQLGFFAKRTAQLLIAGSRLSPMHICGYALSLLATLIGISVAAYYRFGLPFPDAVRGIAVGLSELDVNRWQLCITTMASGIMAHAMQRSLMDDDLRKATLYKLTEEKLTTMMHHELPQVEASCATGGEDALQHLLDETREILGLEHAVWATTLPATRRRRHPRHEPA